ncbi:MAG: di-heme oxidoredictase family protein [Granulosicoccus sp.]
MYTFAFFALTVVLCLQAAQGLASELRPYSAVEQQSVPAAIWPEVQRVRDVLKPGEDFAQAEPFELMQGGAGTQRLAVDRNAYSHETSTLDFEGLQNFKLGNALFNKFWIASPSSTLASDGLGPFYNARACQSCHIKDGRGQLPQHGEKTTSLVLQLKNKVGDQWQGDPMYGNQLQTSAVPGVAAEGWVKIEETSRTVNFSDGTKHELQDPIYTLDELAYGDMDPNTRISPRIAPAMIGLGLLEAIQSEHILAYADPSDADGDGISGRANWQVLTDGSRVLGRFGHKAAMSSVREQNVHALLTDMGLSTAALTNPQGDCTDAQRVCATLAHGDQSQLGLGEAPVKVVDLITFYAANLAVPARRNVDDPEVLLGKSLFYSSRCTACHIPKHVTARDAHQEEHAFQLIWPYTDLLLHDMGEMLADNAGEGSAEGREWRTSPLWGIGLAKRVNPNTSFLHDGRAKTLLDAVLWHGGEAKASRDKVVAMTARQRNALIRFLESL